MKFHIYPRLFVFLVFGFVFATIIGTQTHEYGHYIAAKFKGYKPVLHYQSVSLGFLNREKIALLDSLYKADESQIIAKENSPKKTHYLQYRTALGHEIENSAIITRMAGPLETMITGTTGVIILWLGRKKIRAKDTLSFKNWLTVLLAFFWSRQLGNLLLKTVHSIISPHRISRGDETFIAKRLNLNEWSIITVLGVISALILTWIVFYIIPKQQRFTFVAAGIAGSALGALIWFGWIGPVILP